jgi:hypothetical protein
MQQASGGGSSGGGGNPAPPNTLTIYGQVSDNVTIAGASVFASSFVGKKVEVYEYGTITKSAETEIKSDHTYTVSDLPLNRAYTVKIVGENLEAVVFGASAETERTKKVNIDQISTVVAEAISANAAAKDVFENFTGQAADKVKESLQAVVSAAEEYYRDHNETVPNKTELASEVKFTPTRTIKFIAEIMGGDFRGSHDIYDFTIKAEDDSSPIESKTYTEDFGGEIYIKEYTYPKGTPLEISVAPKGDTRGKAFLAWEFNTYEDKRFVETTILEFGNGAVPLTAKSRTENTMIHDYALNDHQLIYVQLIGRNSIVEVKTSEERFDFDLGGEPVPVYVKKDNDKLYFRIPPTQSDMNRFELGVRDESQWGFSHSGEVRMYLDGNTEAVYREIDSDWEPVAGTRQSFYVTKTDSGNGTIFTIPYTSFEGAGISYNVLRVDIYRKRDNGKEGYASDCFFIRGWK